MGAWEGGGGAAASGMRLPVIHVVRGSRCSIKFISVVKYKLSNNEKCSTNMD